MFRSTFYRSLFDKNSVYFSTSKPTRPDQAQESALLLRGMFSDVPEERDPIIIRPNQQSTADAYAAAPAMRSNEQRPHYRRRAFSAPAV